MQLGALTCPTSSQSPLDTHLMRLIELDHRPDVIFPPFPLPLGNSQVAFFALDHYVIID